MTNRAYVGYNPLVVFRKSVFQSHLGEGSPVVYVRAIAIPHGAALVWIRVGSRLDPILARWPDEVVTRIANLGTGFRLETCDAATEVARYYEVPGYVVSRVELWSGESRPVAHESGNTPFPLQSALA